MRHVGYSPSDFWAEETSYKDFLNRDQMGQLVLLAHTHNHFMLKYDKYTTTRSVWDQVKEDLGGTTITRLRQLQMNFDRFV